MSEPRADILVVDDTPAFLEVLRTMLQEQGYRVRPVPNGRIALSAVEQRRPDLILLDIEMPELNGFETCERLREDERFRDIPVIFLSALTATTDKVRAFEAGGVDYVTKPFQAEEVIARVGTHLRIRRLQQTLAAQYEALRRLESLRDSLTHMIVHDLRSPLQGIMMSLQLLETDGDRLGGTAPDVIKRGLRSTRTMIQMISTLLDVNKMEAGEMPLRRSPGDLNAVVSKALESIAGLVEGRAVGVESDGPVPASFDQDIMVRVVTNLVANALKFTPAEAQVTVRAGHRRGGACVEVIDRGPGIPPEYHHRIFEKFGQVDTPRGPKPFSTGLGLAFCKLALDAHGGEIGVESVVGEGSTFWFVLR